MSISWEDVRYLVEADEERGMSDALRGRSADVAGTSHYRDGYAFGLKLRITLETGAAG